jgi:beta-lactamase regulating signal transducer with metallopeptidase domain
MTDFLLLLLLLLLLGKVNLAMGAAILLVWLLRRLVRAEFGAAVAYALWLTVPVAALASLLPPRTVPPAISVTMQIPAAPIAVPTVDAPLITAHPALTLPAGHIAPITARAASFDYPTLLFVVWVLGVVVMLFHLARLQLRFHAAARAGEAGPAVMGFFRPRVVVPSCFDEQFSATERAAILAHEEAHLARQDARINALAALLRALCWFNPLIHLGARWLRADQELACDAAAMAKDISRRDYANALLKSQIANTPVPLGCTWPGSEHPLAERIALLKRKPLGRARRVIGIGLVVLAASGVGLGAWAAQPPVPGKVIAAASANRQIALTTPPANQNAENQPMAAIAPASDAAQGSRVTKAVSTGAPSALPVIQEPEQKIALALNEAADAALAKAASDASGSLTDGTAAQRMAAGATMPVAAASPAGAATSIPADPELSSALEVLSKNGCHPIIGTLANAHSDPQLLGSDIVLGDILPSSLPVATNLGAGGLYWRSRGLFAAFIPTEYRKNFPALDSYIGQRVAVWPGRGGRPGEFFEIEVPGQLQLLSATLANPKKTWCYLSPIQREYPASAEASAGSTQSLQVPPDQPITYVSVATRFVARGDVRPEVAQKLGEAVQLAKLVRRNPDGIVAKFNQAAAVPNLTNDELRAVAQARAILFGPKTGDNGSFWAGSGYLGPYAIQPPKVSSYLPPGDVGPNNPN